VKLKTKDKSHKIKVKKEAIGEAQDKRFKERQKTEGKMKGDCEI